MVTRSASFSFVRSTAAGTLGLLILATTGIGAVIRFSPAAPIIITEDSFFDPIIIDLDGNDIDDISFNNREIQVDSTPLGINRIIAASGDPDLLESRLAADRQSGDFIGLDVESPLQWGTNRLSLNGCASGGGGVV